MITVELAGNITVKQYSYRTAMVGDDYLNLPRELMNDLEEALAKKAGTRPDNHTVYEVTYDGHFGKKITYIWFHDQMVVFGSRLIEGRH